MTAEALTPRTEVLTQREEDILKSLITYAFSNPGDDPTREESFHHVLYLTQEWMVQKHRWPERVFHFEEAPSSNGRTTQYSEGLHVIIDALVEKGYLNRDRSGLLYKTPKVMQVYHTRDRV